VTTSQTFNPFFESPNFTDFPMTHVPLSNDSELASRFQRLENQSRELATKIQQHDPDSDEATALKQELTETVEQAFAVRQKLQTAQAEGLRKQLDAIESRIQRREEKRDSIVGRRVQELIGGSDLEEWNPLKLNSPSNLRTAAPDNAIGGCCQVRFAHRV